MNEPHTSEQGTILLSFIVGIIIGLAIMLSVFSYLTNKHNQSIQQATSTPSTATTSVASVPTTKSVKLYYVALSDNGYEGKKIGCGDSIIPITTSITPTTTPLRGALEALFAGKTRSIPHTNLTNILASSTLKVDTAIIVNSQATVKISGTYNLAGVCDDPRFVSQIQETVLQFPAIKKATILLNNKPLESALSEK